MSLRNRVLWVSCKYTQRAVFFVFLFFFSQLHSQLRESFTAGLKRPGFYAVIFYPNFKTDMKVEFYLLLLMGKQIVWEAINLINLTTLCSQCFRCCVTSRQDVAKHHVPITTDQCAARTADQGKHSATSVS